MPGDGTREPARACVSRLKTLVRSIGRIFMETLRQIPPVNDVLRSDKLAEFHRILGQPFVGAILNEVLSEMRRDLPQSKSATSRTELTTRIAEEVARRLRGLLKPSLRRVINASGVILHTNLGRAPLSEGAMEH